MRPLLLFAALSLLAVSCFNPETPACSFSCGDSGQCPDDYMCLSDGYCHYKGIPSACLYSDASANVGPDLRGIDGPTPGDGGANPDGGATDIGIPDLSQRHD
jgi:hypothetical protein